MAAAMGLVDREEIALGLACGESPAVIARRIGRQRSTVTREIARNTEFAYIGTPYRGSVAQKDTDRRRARPRPGKLAAGPLRRFVTDGLRERWSPQQIAASSRRDFPDRPELWVSHETIYQAVYLQARGSLREELTDQVALLRSGRTRRRPRSRVPKTAKVRPWLSLMIADRPPEVADRAVPGHWEGDLLVGVRSASAIATLVERTSRFVILVSLPDGRTSEYVVDQLAAAMRGLPGQLRRSLTWDQGSELAAHARFTLAADCTVYFCDPHSPWQRGSGPRGRAGGPSGRGRPPAVRRPARARRRARPAGCPAPLARRPRRRRRAPTGPAGRP